MFDGDLTGFIVVVAVSIGAFLLLRELFCWYYKINRVIELLAETNMLLRSQLEMTSVWEGRRVQREAPAASASTVGLES